MSSRQLKKLRAREERKKKVLTEADTSDADEISSDEEDADAVVDTRPRPSNPFAAFAALGGDDEAEHDEDEDENDIEEAKEESPGTQAASVEQPARAKPSRKKKKKKKGKGKNEAAGGSVAVADNASLATPDKITTRKKNHGAVDNKDDGLDEIDRALEELNLKTAAQTQQTGKTPGLTTRTSSAARITISFHDLKVFNELRDVFGRETIQAVQADEAGNAHLPQGERAEGNPGVVMVDLETFLRGTPPIPHGMNGRRAAAILHAHGRKQMADVVARRNPFIEFKDTWPRAASGGLSMRQVTPAADAKLAESVIEYTFVHGPTYVQMEDTFFTLVLLHNHQPLIQFLKRNPYHISSLIQVSRVAKQDQNASLAADLCERALFSFGRSTLSSFRQKLGDGLARLSFRRPENRQFLLAGYYYIKSLIRRGTQRTALAWTKLFLSTMPDDDYALFLYGHVLAIQAFDARWLLDVCHAADEDDKDGFPALSHNPMKDYIQQTLVLARLQIKDTEGARTALMTGMARLPWLYGALFQALNLDVPRAVWGIQPRDEVESLYTQLYVQQAKDIWDTSPATALLKEVAGALSRPDPAALPPAEPVTLNVARFVYLDGTPAMMALVPNGMLHVSPNYDFDPLPPAREENEFSNKAQERPWIMGTDDNQLTQGVAWRALAALQDDIFVPPRNDDDDGVFVEEPDDDDGGDETGTEGGMDEDDIEEVDADTDAAQTSPPPPAWRPGRGMPGAWVEDASDEEDDLR